MQFWPIFSTSKNFSEKKFFGVSARSQRVLTVCEENFQNFGDTAENELMQISWKFIKLPFFLFSKFIKIDLKFTLMWTGRISERGGISEKAHTNRPNLSWKNDENREGKWMKFMKVVAFALPTFVICCEKSFICPSCFGHFFQLKLGRFVWAFSEIPPNFRFT